MSDFVKSAGCYDVFKVLDEGSEVAMRKLLKSVLLVYLILVVIAILAGCTVYTTARHDQHSIDARGAQSARVEIHMGAGRLNLNGNADAMLDADFVYNQPEWKPEMTYVVQNGQGELVVSQPEQLHLLGLGGNRYEWTLNLNNQIPLQVKIDLGAGETNLILGDLNLSRLELNSGAASALVDLSGTHAANLDVLVQMGVGHLKLRLPRTVGVRVEMSGGLGDSGTGELIPLNGALVNEAYGQSDAQINVKVSGGIGAVTFELTD